MPLNVEIKGDPTSIAATAQQLRSLASAVQESGTAALSVRSESESEWSGPAGNAFRCLLARLQAAIDDHEQDLLDTARGLQTYVDDLITVKAAMTRACEIARDGGLQVTATTISDPGSPSPSPSPFEQRAYAAKVEAFQAAGQIVRQARQRLAQAGRLLSEFLSGVKEKAAFNVADFGSGIGAALTGVGSSFFTHTMNLYEEFSKLAAFEKKTMRTVPWLPKLEEQIFKNFRLSAWLNAPMGTKGVLKLLPQTGFVVTTLGVEYDIAVAKKDPLTAIVSGYGGYAVGALVGAAVLNPLGAVGAACFGFGASLLSGFFIEKAMD
jgi:hypothetical protein